MSLDPNNQPVNPDPVSTPHEAPDELRQQEVPARDNPEPLVAPSTYPGSIPSFFPYARYPNLTWQPRVDIFEDHDSFLVVVEVPGVNPEQLDVENSSNLLLIRGQNRQASGSGSEEMIPRYQERVYGDFFREISLPPNAGMDQAQASCRHGLLEIKIPKLRTSSGQLEARH